MTSLFEYNSEPLLPDLSLFTELDNVNIFSNENNFELSYNLESLSCKNKLNVGLDLDSSDYQNCDNLNMKSDNEFVNRMNFALYNSSNLDDYPLLGRNNIEEQVSISSLDSSDKIKSPSQNICSSPFSLESSDNYPISSDSHKKNPFNDPKNISDLDEFHSDLEKNLNKFDTFINDYDLGSYINKTEEFSINKFTRSVSSISGSSEPDLSNKLQEPTILTGPTSPIVIKTIKYLTDSKTKCKLSNYPFKIIVKSAKKKPESMVASLNIPKINNFLTQIPQSQKYYAGLPSPPRQSSCEQICSDKQTTKTDLLNTSNDSSEEETIESESSSCSNVTNVKTRGMKRKLNDLPFRSLNKIQIDDKSSLRRKIQKSRAYELEPLRDPQLERCRKNAVNAKKNRDLKKIKMIELEREVEVERETNLYLSEENKCLRLREKRLKMKVQKLLDMLKNSKSTDLMHSQA